MENTAAKNRRNGIIAGAICFIGLFSPALAIILIGLSQGFDAVLLTIAFVFTLIIPAAAAFFFGYSVTKRSIVLILLASLVIILILVLVVFVFMGLTQIKTL